MAVAVQPRHEPVTHEEVVSVRGPRSGTPMVVAVHSTALGPALGGVRVWAYERPEDAERDALRLSEGMTLKAAAAKLDLGGGKGVICAPTRGFDPAARRAALLDFGDLVESLGGRYITAEDVGVSPADITVIAERTPHVTGLPPDHGGSGDPSPVTALGVEAAILACAAERWGDRDLGGRRVTVVGVGHVGARLARLLRERGCDLTLCDIDPAKRALAAELGARWADPEEAAAAECDVLAPCALGGIVTVEVLPRLRCRIICGSANNQLADDSLADALASHGILYAPDFIANAGGLINVFGEIRGYDAEAALERARGIEATMSAVFAEATRRRTTPLAAARALAAGRLDAAVAD